MPRWAKILLAVLGGLFLLGALAVVAVLLLAGGAAFLAYRAQQHYLAQARTELMYMELSMLGENIAMREARGDAIASCGSEAEATAALEKGPTLKHVPQACLVDLGMDDYPIYGQYWVEVRPDGITVGAVMDNDGDGAVAKVTEVPGGSPTKLTPDGVY